MHPRIARTIGPILFCLSFSGAHAGDGPPAADAAIPGDVALQIEIRNLHPGEGQLLLGVCLESQFLKPSCAFQTVLPVTANPQRVTVPADRLPPGRYGVQVVYDRNGNGRLDRGVLGIPAEPVGFSNDAVGRFGPPSFRQAAIQYGGAPLQLVISVH